MTLSDRDRKIMLALVPLVVLVAYWFLLLAPKREEAATATQDAAKQKQRLDAGPRRGRPGQGRQDELRRRLRRDRAPRQGHPGAASTCRASSCSSTARPPAPASASRRSPRASATAAPARATPRLRTTPPAASTGSRRLPAPPRLRSRPAAQTAQSAPGTAHGVREQRRRDVEPGQRCSRRSPASTADTTSTSTRRRPADRRRRGVHPARRRHASWRRAVSRPCRSSSSSSGNFFNLADFFHDVKRFVHVANSNVVVSGRLVTIDGVKFASEQQIFPKIKAELTATVYLSPLGQGATAGATPAGPLRRPAPPHRRPGPRRRLHGIHACACDSDSPDRCRDPLRTERCKSSSSMLWHDLREKRLAPVAIVLLLGLVAVPVLLAKPAEDPAPARRLAAAAQEAEDEASPRCEGQARRPGARQGSGSTLGVFDPNNPFHPPKGTIKKDDVSAAGAGPSTGSQGSPGAGSTGAPGATGGAGGGVSPTGGGDHRRHRRRRRRPPPRPRPSSTATSST